MKLLSSSLLLFLTGFAIAQEDPWLVCPPPDTISPCVCKKTCSDCNAVFACADLTTQTQFEEVIQKSDYPFRAARIENSTLQYIPHQLFEEKKFQQLIIKNCTFLDLIDGRIEGDTPLNYLWLEDLTIRHKFKFDVFSPMKELYFLLIQNIEVRKIPNDVCSTMFPKLNTLSLFDTNTMRIGSTAFSTCGDLKYLYVTGGIVKTIEGSMFPSGLEYLGLRRQKIKTLPEDFASALPNLKSLTLDHNQLSYIDEKVFGNMPALLSLNVKGNPIICDCKLKWKISRSTPSIQGSCSNLNNKKISSLTSDDFSIC